MSEEHPVIPSEAVEAAVQAYIAARADRGGELWLNMRDALTAAAPLMTGLGG